MSELRLPAEWEEQVAVQLTWPHRESDWLPQLKAVEDCFAQIAKEITLREKLILVCREPEHVLSLLKSAGAELANVITAQIQSNDTWARDHAGITIYNNGRAQILDFAFNGWGLKYKANFDNQITRKLVEKGVLKNCNLQTLGFVLEGGAIESDGQGTLMTTSNCLLSPNRNPQLAKDEIEESLKEFFGLKRLLWLNHGYMAGDDTDSHIDTLARFCNPSTIAYMACDDPADEHYAELKAMEEELKGFRTLDGQPYNLIRLPMGKASFDDEGSRLPATYANFLIINRAVLVPTYADPADQVALKALAAVFPDREVIGIDCRCLIIQHGSLHCVTMQYPKGVELS